VYKRQNLTIDTDEVVEPPTNLTSTFASTSLKRKTTDDFNFEEPQRKSPRANTNKGGKTLKQKRRHYSTKRTKLTNNKKHTKYMKKKILRKTRTK
jgi:hypothetical protein